MLQHSVSELATIRAYLRARTPSLVRLLRKLVEMESPSTDKAAVDRLARILAREWRRRGARTTFVRHPNRGNLLRAEAWLGRGPARREQILLLGHLDTVYDRGTLRRMPFRARAGRAFGPGAFDMKSGVVIGLAAVDALRTFGLAPTSKLVFLYSSDEEIGSDASRPVVEREARRSHAVLVLEPAAGAEGALKTGRKGVAEFELIVRGRAAHAGLEPEKGVSATLELAWQIPRIVALARARRGLTVNVGIIAGGTRSNVVAAEARAQIDLRSMRRADAAWAERRLRALRPVLPGARLELRRKSIRPPLERTAGVIRLFRLAQQVGRDLGLRLRETSVGGGSDGNFTAALGVPTLDGLGGVGAGAHSPQEYVVVSSLAERATLLAGLLLRL